LTGSWAWIHARKRPAVVLNAMGFVGRPLHLFPEFMATKPREIWIRKRMEAEDFRETILRRPKGIFMRIAANFYNEYGG